MYENAELDVDDFRVPAGIGLDADLTVVDGSDFAGGDTFLFEISCDSESEALSHASSSTQSII